MTERAISKRKAGDSVNAEEARVSTAHGDVYRAHIVHGLRSAELAIAAASALHDIGHTGLVEKLSERLESWSEHGYLVRMVVNIVLMQLAREESVRARTETRLEQLEEVTSAQGLKLRRLQAPVELVEEPEQENEQIWPEFASEDFKSIVENTSGLENAGEDKALLLYHIMEIETLLGRVEKKARATSREYEARLAASLRDICRIHEPSELSDEQIECLTGSLQALTEGWGQLTREKLKWIRSRLLRVGLTWLPVTEKAQVVIDEAKSSVT